MVPKFDEIYFVVHEHSQILQFCTIRYYLQYKPLKILLKLFFHNFFSITFYVKTTQLLQSIFRGLFLFCVKKMFLAGQKRHGYLSRWHMVNPKWDLFMVNIHFVTMGEIKETGFAI